MQDHRGSIRFVQEAEAAVKGNTGTVTLFCDVSTGKAGHSRGNTLGLASLNNLGGIGGIGAVPSYQVPGPVLI